MTDRDRVPDRVEIHDGGGVTEFFDADRPLEISRPYLYAGHRAGLVFMENNAAFVGFTPRVLSPAGLADVGTIAIRPSDARVIARALLEIADAAESASSPPQHPDPLTDSVDTDDEGHIE